MVAMLERSNLRHKRCQSGDDSSTGPRHQRHAINFELEIGADTLENMNCSGIVYQSVPGTNSTYNISLDSSLGNTTTTPAPLSGCDTNNCGPCQTELNISFTPALSQILLAPTSSTGPIIPSDGDNSTTGEVINSFYFYEVNHPILMP
ncbi:hypothetical protein DMENIID0001_149240 [Sergentomyia squamirostris]